MAACTDPGVIPKMEQRSTVEMAQYVPFFYFANRYIKNKNSLLYLMVNQGKFNGTPVLTQSLKFCETCHIFKPPRTAHCQVCDCCVRSFDHHCLWLGVCIGERNFIAFQSFVALINLALPVLIVQALRAITHIADKEAENIIGSTILSLYVLVLVIVSKTKKYNSNRYRRLLFVFFRLMCWYLFYSFSTCIYCV